jgi:ribosomal protein S13
MSDAEKQIKKIKKQIKNLKNRHNQAIFQHAEQHSRERDLDREREEEVREFTRKASSRGAEEKKGEPVWSARMQEIRSKIDGKKRMADDRWNRFAGTDGAGAMGR